MVEVETTVVMIMRTSLVEEIGDEEIGSLYRSLPIISAFHFLVLHCVRRE